MISRRSFIGIGITGAFALAAGGLAWRAAHPSAPHRFVLDREGRDLLTALVPTMVGQMVPSAEPARTLAVAATVERVRIAIAGLPLATQQELQDLFGLLCTAPARRLLAGLPSWHGATPSELAAFLESWRLHRFALLRQAYQGLHALILGSWYADPSSWAAIGYPGPMQELAT